MLSQPLMLGSIYRLKLKGRFERHGVCSTAGAKCLHPGNGVFRLEQISTFRDLVRAGIDLLNNFFTPVGISEDEYRAYFSDKPADEYEPEYVKQTVVSTKTEKESYTPEGTTETVTKDIVKVTTTEIFKESGRSILKKHADDSIAYANYPIYKFSDVVDSEDIIYVPELAIDGFPEIDISAYRDLSLVFNLGLFDKPEQLDPMLLAIRERMAIYGIRPKNIKLYSTGTKWLNPDEYNAVKALRQPTVTGIIPEIPVEDPDSVIDQYVNKQIVVAGALKKLVKDTPSTSREVQISKLASKPVNVDATLFLTECKQGEVFKDGVQYYEQKTWDDPSQLVLVEDFNVGDPVISFVPHTVTAEDKSTNYARFFKKSEVKYVMYNYGTERNNTKGYGTEEGESTNKVPTYYYYKYVKTVVDDVVTEEGYIPASKEDIEDVTIPLYRMVPETYVPCTAEDAQSWVVGTTEDTEVYESKSVTRHGVGIYKKENYLSSGALELLGGKLDYVNPDGIGKSLTLDLASIVTLAQQVEKTVSMSPEVRTRYEGRVAQYFLQDPVTGEYYGVQFTITASGTIPADGTVVDIMGQSGIWAKELQFLEEQVSGRNYYLEYVRLKQDNDAKQAYISALEDYITKMNSQPANS